MQILLICHDEPQDRSYGAGLRTNSIWRALSKVGEVSVLVMAPSYRTTLRNGSFDGELGRIDFQRPAFPWWTPQTQSIRRLVATVVGRRHFDLVVVRYLRLAMIVRGSVLAPIVVDGDDLDKVTSVYEKSMMLRMRELAKSTGRRLATKRAIKNFAHVWYVNPRDMHTFPTRSGSLLPNTVDAPHLLLPRRPPHQPVVLMVGKYGYEPNAEGAEFFIRSVLPVLRAAEPSTRFRLVGSCPQDLAARWSRVEGVDVAGFIDDLGAEYAAASFVVAPVFSGGGTQIKVLEALGHECAAVVSSFSAAGFSRHLVEKEHLLVAESVDEWVAQCSRLIGSPATAHRLGAAGRKAVMASYSFEGMVREVRATTSRLVRSHP